MPLPQPCCTLVTLGSTSMLSYPLPSAEPLSWIVIAIHHRKSACTIILSRKPSNAACTLEHSKTPMDDSSHDGPQLFRGTSNINTNGGILNQVGRDQYNNYQHSSNYRHYNNYNNTMNNEMVVRQPYQ